MMKQPVKKLTLGVLAHVDAGKTTLSEALLYETGVIRRLGRVDHQDAFLDTDVQERQRGITIFSKQAELKLGTVRAMLVDTPGHVDFSAEMERTLQILDYAILVISGKDGVQGHTATLWKLLQRYEIPTFLFINKMDLEGTDKAAILSELKHSLDDRCVDFTDAPQSFDGRDLLEDFGKTTSSNDAASAVDAIWAENVSVCDENLLEEYLEAETVSREHVADGIAARRIFPCYFGSALKLEGVQPLMKGIVDFSVQKSYPQEFAARVYKITRDERGNRLTHLKITGGTLRVKEQIAMVRNDDGSEEPESLEKVDQIRIYSGTKFRTSDAASAGDICAVTGLKSSYAGQSLGREPQSQSAVLESVLLYRVILPPEQDVHTALQKLKQLEEEDPQLHIIWNEQLQEIQIQLMGEVQLEILQYMIAERFGIQVGFGEGKIAYKETIKAPVTGGGHFEPLRHYAEVQLLLEPGAPGSGMVFDSLCSEDVLDKNWQRLILTHLMEREHIGVLVGAPITDMKISILTGRAHLKHTEGGDFRQATYRAIRQGLRKAESVLLEPWYEFRLEVPMEHIGRAMSDIQKMDGSFQEPECDGAFSVLRGKAPVSEMKDYAIEVVSYTKGRGHLSCTLSGYAPCHNAEQVIAESGYDVDADLEHTADSVFCQHGAGFNVRWNQVDDYLHTDSGWKPDAAAPVTGGRQEGAAFPEENSRVRFNGTAGGRSAAYRGSLEEDRVLERTIARNYGVPEPKPSIPKRVILSDAEKKKTAPAKIRREYLLVDGYNIIFAWEQLKSLAKVNIDAAREALIEILSNYQGYRRCHVIVVFDAYKVKGGERHFERHENVDVVYTKEAETADTYIEKTTHDLGRECYVRVATSDRLEQMIVLGNGAFRVSAKEFLLEIEQANAEIAAYIENLSRKNWLDNRKGIVIPAEKREPEDDGA